MFFDFSLILGIVRVLSGAPNCKPWVQMLLLKCSFFPRYVGYLFFFRNGAKNLDMKNFTKFQIPIFIVRFLSGYSLKLQTLPPNKTTQFFVVSKI